MKRIALIVATWFDENATLNICQATSRAKLTGNRKVIRNRFNTHQRHFQASYSNELSERKMPTHVFIATVRNKNQPDVILNLIHLNRIQTTASAHDAALKKDACFYSLVSLEDGGNGDGPSPPGRRSRDEMDAGRNPEVRPGPTPPGDSKVRVRPARRRGPSR